MYPPSATNNFNPPSQPPAASHCNVSTGIPVNPGNYSAVRPPRGGPWSSGLCDCCLDVHNCCITCWCPSITFGQIAEIVDKGSSSCWLSGAAHAVFGYVTGRMCSFCLSYTYRSKMRKEYSLRNSPCNDFLVHCFCEPCALCQEYRELTDRGYDVSMGWHGNVEMRNREMSMNPGRPAPPVQESMTR